MRRAQHTTIVDGRTKLSKEESHHLGFESIAAHWPTKDISNRDTDLWSNRNNCSSCILCHTRCDCQGSDSHFIDLRDWHVSETDFASAICRITVGLSWLRKWCSIIANDRYRSSARAEQCSVRGHHVHSVWCLRAVWIIKFLSRQSYKSLPLLHRPLQSIQFTEPIFLLLKFAFHTKHQRRCAFCVHVAFYSLVSNCLSFYSFFARVVNFDGFFHGNATEIYEDWNGHDIFIRFYGKRR